MLVLGDSGPWVVSWYYTPRFSLGLGTVHFGAPNIMAYGRTPYVGMTPKKNGGHIKSVQMTHLKYVLG